MVHKLRRKSRKGLGLESAKTFVYMCHVSFTEDISKEVGIEVKF